MNILDYQAEKYHGDVTAAIFEKMKALVSYYKKFEVSIKDLDLPVDIDTFEGQQAMKDFLEIRVVEELMEMREAIIEGERIEHIYEEISDSLNFLISSYILYGWDFHKFKSLHELWVYTPIPKTIVTNLKILDPYIIDIIYQIGITCNKLKIRPWKKSQYLTDMLIFEERFEQVYYKFFNLIFRGIGLSPDDLWSVFSRKNQCNKFRIDTGY